MASHSSIPAWRIPAEDGVSKESDATKQQTSQVKGRQSVVPVKPESVGQRAAKSRWSAVGVGFDPPALPSASLRPGQVL